MSLSTKTDVAQFTSRYRNVPSVSSVLTRGGNILKHHLPGLVVSKQKLRRQCDRLRPLEEAGGESERRILFPPIRIIADCP
jgi:hypothetical protein